MLFDLLGYLVPGGPYFQRAKVRRGVKDLRSGRQVIIEALKLPEEGKAVSGYLRLELPSIWWRPNRESSLGEALICQNRCTLAVRPVDDDAFSRGAPKYWTMVTIMSDQKDARFS